MQTVFRDMVGLKRGLQEVTVEALNDTIVECYKELLEIINEDVYKKAKHECGEHFYERTYDMLHAFVIKYAEIKGLGIRTSASIDFDESKISHNTILKQHGSNQELDADVFFGILNNDVKQGTAFTHVEREPFFNDWLEWMDKNYEAIYRKHLGERSIAQRRKSQSAKGL